MYNSRNLSLFTYSHNNPMVLVDPDGNNAVGFLMAAWLAYEGISGAYDVANASATWSDPNASDTEKAVAMGSAMLSVCGPGGGYGKWATNRAARAVAASKAVRKESGEVTRGINHAWDKRMGKYYGGEKGKGGNKNIKEFARDVENIIKNDPNPTRKMTKRGTVEVNAYKGKIKGKDIEIRVIKRGEKLEDRIGEVLTVVEPE